MFETITVDRREDYYANVGAFIAADPLDFYCRAERGRRWLALRSWLVSEYERTERLDASPSTDNYDFFEETMQ